MKKLSLLAASLLVSQVSFAAALVADTAGGVSFNATTSKTTFTVTNPTPLPSTRSVGDISCTLIGANEPDVKVSASSGVGTLMRCHATARGIGVAAQHGQGRPKACGPTKAEACIYAGTTLGGKTMGVKASKTMAVVVNTIADGTLVDD